MNWIEDKKCPRTDGCDDPCPWICCRYHLWSDVAVSRRGGTFIIDEEIDPLDMAETCAIDVAINGPISLLETGEIMGGITKERVRQIEYVSLIHLRIAIYELGLSRNIIVETLREVDRLRSYRDDTIWSEPGLDGRIGRKSFGKMVSDALKKLIPERSRRYLMVM